MMMSRITKDGFFITISSKDQVAVRKSTSSFTVRLKHPFYVGRDWEVGLHQLILDNRESVGKTLDFVTDVGVPVPDNRTEDDAGTLQYLYMPATGHVTQDFKVFRPVNKNHYTTILVKLQKLDGSLFNTDRSHTLVTFEFRKRRPR